MATETYPIASSPLYNLQSKRALAHALGVSESHLQWLSKLPPEESYAHWDKITGCKKRAIESPPASLRRIQKRLHGYLRAIETPDYVVSPSRGRSHVSNAQRHRGAREIAVLDIKKYYASTGSARVSTFFVREMRMSPQVAKLLTALTTVDGHLPLGSPHSAMLAYFANQDMWDEIAATCFEHGASPTLYMDDLTISGAAVDGVLLWEVRKIIHRHKFALSKLKRYRRGGIVTGVFASKDDLAIPHAKQRLLRQLDTTARQESAPARLRHARRRAGLRAEHTQIRRAASRV